MRLYRCNDDYFGTVKTQERAYWLGFLAADGCVKHNRGSLVVAVALAEQDRGHLERFREALGITAPVHTETSTASCRVQVYSAQLAEDLSRFGVVPRKSATIRWPELPPDLLSHYLRGYFDGDGCVHVPKSAPVYRSWFSIVSNTEFLLGLQAYLGETLGFGANKFGRWNKTAGYEYAALAYSGLRQLEAFYRLIYGGATVWLPRKREKFPCHDSSSDGAASGNPSIQTSR